MIKIGTSLDAGPDAVKNILFLPCVKRGWMGDNPPLTPPAQCRLLLCLYLLTILSGIHSASSSPQLNNFKIVSLGRIWTCVPANTGPSLAVGCLYLLSHQGNNNLVSSRTLYKVLWCCDLISPVNPFKGVRGVWYKCDWIVFLSCFNVAKSSRGGIWQQNKLLRGLPGSHGAKDHWSNT